MSHPYFRNRSSPVRRNATKSDSTTSGLEYAKQDIHQHFQQLRRGVHHHRRAYRASKGGGSPGLRKYIVKPQCPPQAWGKSHAAPLIYKSSGAEESFIPSPGIRKCTISGERPLRDDKSINIVRSERQARVTFACRVFSHMFQEDARPLANPSAHAPKVHGI